VATCTGATDDEPGKSTARSYAVDPDVAFIPTFHKPVVVASWSTRFGLEPPVAEATTVPAGL
jgi:hypothetical protein